MKKHDYYMDKALDEAKKALIKGEVPVGAVIVKDDEIISQGHNLRETMKEPTAHAELIAIRKAAMALKRWRLFDCKIYVTLEPCPMCAGAINQARLEALVYGAMDIKAGSAGTVYNLVSGDKLPHKSEIISGILEDKCKDLMVDFFEKIR